jgi:glycosyltransferase involved in cell wall biosynthesis
MKIVIATPSLAGPTEPYKRALAGSAPLMENAHFIQEIGNPYISAARATMLRKAMDGQADVVVFIDYDLSWKPEDLLTLINTPGEVVAGTYRFKKDEEEYMGGWQTDATGRPVLRDDGCIKADRIPAGFTAHAMRRLSICSTMVRSMASGMARITPSPSAGRKNAAISG